MDPNPVTLGDLYPQFTAEQLEEADSRLELYLAVVARIVERLRSEGYDLTAADLTASSTEATIPHAKVDSNETQRYQP
jgi:hypothetical protein